MNAIKFSVQAVTLTLIILEELVKNKKIFKFQENADFVMPKLSNHLNQNFKLTRMFAN
jgi:hypothetical protein